MKKPSTIQTIYDTSFRANLYTTSHFRMIGLIDVQMALKSDSENIIKTS